MPRARASAHVLTPWHPPLDRPYRNDALALAAHLLPALGDGWILDADGGAKLVSLLLHLACIEVRLSVEERPSPERDAKAAAVLPAACRVVETIIAMLSDPADGPARPSLWVAMPEAAAARRLNALPAETLLKWQQVLQTTFLAIAEYLRDWHVSRKGRDTRKGRDARKCRDTKKGWGARKGRDTNSAAWSA